jgi:hemoglobin/transferrin/lactoferrin receptor protein
MGKPVKIFLVTIFCIAFCYGLYVNLTQASEDIYVLDEITITGTRNERDTFSTPSAMSVVTSEELERQSFGTAADALNETAGVQIQKTTQGQGSPIIRGLTGYQTLILIDGVRLNSSTFRSGPNQYMATIDPGQIYRIEVMRGHGSSLYGTSAMGGVINVLTKSPVIMPKGFSLIPHVSTKFSSADSAKNARIEFVGGYKNLGFVFGGSYKDVGNIKPGKGYDIQLPNKKFYITSQSNPKNLPEGAWLVDTESPTSWKEKDGDVKLNYLIADGQDIKLAYQAVRQKDIPRYDKLGDKEYDIFLFTPQNRDLIYANYSIP